MMVRTAVRPEIFFRAINSQFYFSSFLLPFSINLASILAIVSLIFRPRVCSILPIKQTILKRILSLVSKAIMPVKPWRLTHRYRRIHEAGPWRLNAAMSRNAAGYARKLTNGRFKHSPKGSRTDRGNGENLVYRCSSYDETTACWPSCKATVSKSMLLIGPRRAMEYWCTASNEESVILRGGGGRFLDSTIFRADF